jgi:hypothetical protein
LHNLPRHVFGCVADAERLSGQHRDRIRPQLRYLRNHAVVLHRGGELVAVRPRHAIRNIMHFRWAEVRVHAAAVCNHGGQRCAGCGCYVGCISGRIAQVQQQDQASNKAGSWL